MPEHGTHQLHFFSLLPRGFFALRLLGLSLVVARPTERAWATALIGVTPTAYFLFFVWTLHSVKEIILAGGQPKFLLLEATVRVS
jgi:hypothetical protein